MLRLLVWPQRALPEERCLPATESPNGAVASRDGRLSLAAGAVVLLAVVVLVLQAWRAVLNHRARLRLLHFCARMRRTLPAFLRQLVSSLRMWAAILQGAAILRGSDILQGAIILQVEAILQV